jgi:acetoin utilization deacetylase AcuC-like enzyme
MTQSAFYENPNVLFISIHKESLCNSKNLSDEKISWARTATGSGKGKGFNLNFPLDVGEDEYFEDSRYLFIFERTIVPIILSFKPDLMVIMNGLECLLDDPIGKLKLTGNCNSNF